MRRAELIAAVVLAALSVYFMIKSAELPIGYVADEGPGGGFWPFWLSAAMLGSVIWIVINWWRRTSPPSRSEEPFLDAYGMKMLALVGGGVTIFIALVHFIGMYGAMLVFLLYYIRFLGRHSWPTAIAISLATPVVMFFFFDVAMRIVLPKGYLEPLFIPLYAVFL